MKRLQLTKFGDPTEVIQLAEIEEPSLKQGELLIRMEAAPLNPSDFMIVKGQYAVQPAFPFDLGSEGAGIIEKTGPGVDPVLLGSRALVLPRYEVGTWAEYVLATMEQIVVVDTDADPQQLCMIGINPATAYLLLKNFVALKPGDWIGQTAANSAVGRYLIQFAKKAGIKTLNVVRRESAGPTVREEGGDIVLVQGSDLSEKVALALEGQKLKAVFDTVGGSVIGQLSPSLAQHAPVIAYAMQSGEYPIIPPVDLFFKGLSLHGFWLINWVRSASRQEIKMVYEDLTHMVQDGSLSAEVEAVYSLEDHEQAVAHAQRSERRGKVLFRF